MTTSPSLIEFARNAQWNYYQEPRHNDAEKYWQEIDEFLLTKKTVQEFVSEKLGTTDVRTNYNVTQRVNSFIGYMLCHRFGDAVSRDEVVNEVSSSTKRGFETSIFSDMKDDIVYNVSLTRDRNNNLYPIGFFKKTQTKKTLMHLLSSAVRDDDGEAIDLLKQIPLYSKALSGKNIETVLKGIDVAPGSKVFAALMGGMHNDKGKADPFQYMSILLALNNKNTVEAAQSLYDPELSQRNGHVFIDFCMRKWNINKSQAQLSLVHKMVGDGADWYLAFKQASVSPSVYLDLAERNINPVEELKEMVKSWKQFPALVRNANVLTEIIKSIPLDLINEAKRDEDFCATIDRVLKKAEKQTKTAEVANAVENMASGHQP